MSLSGRQELSAQRQESLQHCCKEHQNACVRWLGTLDAPICPELLKNSYHHIFTEMLTEMWWKVYSTYIYSIYWGHKAWEATRPTNSPAHPAHFKFRAPLKSVGRALRDSGQHQRIISVHGIFVQKQSADDSFRQHYRQLNLSLTISSIFHSARSVSLENCWVPMSSIGLAYKGLGCLLANILSLNMTPYLRNSPSKVYLLKTLQISVGSLLRLTAEIQSGL